jgi:hypothetical protein
LPSRKCKRKFIEIPGHQSEWLSSRKQTTNAGEVWRGDRNPDTLLMGMEISQATMEIIMKVPQETKNRTIICSSYITPG